MRIAHSWLREFIDVGEATAQLQSLLDDLGLVVEGLDRVGEFLSDVIVAQVREIHPIPGADRIRRVVADRGDGNIEVVCGATNFVVGSFVPFAPVGAVLPGDFVITERIMKGVTSRGMLCSRRELGLGDDHEGLMILDDIGGVEAGQSLVGLLGLVSDSIWDISPEGNRPDAWSVEGVARDVAVRLSQSLKTVALASPNATDLTSSFASISLLSPDLCGRLTVAALRNVTVGPSPSWVRHRIESAGMRPLNNVVDASNYVMLELGQPTHPYDARLVAGQHVGVRQARGGEEIVTLDGTRRVLGVPGAGLGDTGVDCVIVDGSDEIIGLAGIMGGASSVISSTTTDVLVEAAFFDPMTIARSSKRLGLRSEASSRFERGVDPALAPRAVARFVEILRYSSPDLVWMAEPLVASGTVPVPPVIDVSAEDVERLLGTRIELHEAGDLLRGLNFGVEQGDRVMRVTAPSARLDVRSGAPGRADVIEEIARLYSYQRLARRTPTWTSPGALSSRQKFRRLVRESAVGLGLVEAWTSSFVTDDDFTAMSTNPLRVRITNPLSNDESIFRSSMIPGLVRAWSRNCERGLGDVALFEIGVVVEHPGWTDQPRLDRGGVGGHEKVELPTEIEQLLVVFGRLNDDATVAVASWRIVQERLGLRDVIIRSSPVGKSWHPTRSAELVDRETQAVLGYVGELDPRRCDEWAPTRRSGQRLGLLQINLEVAANPVLARRRDDLASIPSRFPSALVDLAFVTPRSVSADDLAQVLRGADTLVEDVGLFDVFSSDALGASVRSLAYFVRLGSSDRTLSDADVTRARAALIEAAQTLGAQLR